MTTREALVVESDGESIGVEVTGSGPAVVLLHGSGGNRATWWQQVVDLAADHRVVVVEARGSGRSTDSAGQSGPVACAADLEVVRAHLAIDRWAVVGHSAGGWTALRYAVTHPERCRSVTLLNTLAGVFPPAADTHWQQLVARLASAPWPPSSDLARPPSLTPDFCAQHPERAYLYQLIGALNPPPDPSAPAMRIRDFDLTPQELGRLTAPVTFVTGDRDDIAPAAAVRAAGAALGARFVEVPGGHLPFFEDPAAFAPVLRAAIDP